MKAPSLLGLRALRALALPPNPTSRGHAYPRCYSSSPPPPPPKPREPAVQRPSAEPGFRTRQRSDDDEDHIPRPLIRPIGMPNPPQPGENRGMDHRSVKQRRDDFVDYDKHLEKRARMTKQIAKPYFRDWSNMRFSKGKVFVAPDRLFRAETALFFPNFFGRTLRQGAAKRDAKDGYGGLGRDTAEVMQGRVSVVSFVSNAWAVNQAETFCGVKENPEIQQLLEDNRDVAQKVEINHENNPLKYWILRFFGMGRLRKVRSPQQQERYFIVRRGVSDIIKEAIGLLNDKGGYVYLVDGECRVRWAGSAIAEAKEKESMVRGLKRLIAEARIARGEKVDSRKELQDAVSEVIEEVPDAQQKAPAAGSA